MLRYVGIRPDLWRQCDIQQLGRRRRRELLEPPQPDDGRHVHLGPRLAHLGDRLRRPGPDEHPVHRCHQRHHDRQRRPLRCGRLLPGERDPRRLAPCALCRPQGRAGRQWRHQVPPVRPGESRWFGVQSGACGTRSPAEPGRELCQDLRQHVHARLCKNPHLPQSRPGL